MIKRTYRKAAVILLASAMMCAPVSFAQEAGETIQSSEEGVPQEPETPAPQPETPAPQPETPAPQPETPAPQTEAPAPQTEAPAPQPETPAPETDPGSGAQNHSTAIPEDPEEKKLKQKIVDAGEDIEGFSVSINGGEPAVIEPDKSFRMVVDAITGGSYGYKMDYVRPGTGLREPIEIEADGTIKTIFKRAKTTPRSLLSHPSIITFTTFSTAFPARWTKSITISRISANAITWRTPDGKSAKDTSQSPRAPENLNDSHTPAIKATSE